MVVILVYVDDFLITGDNVTMINEVKDILYQQFKPKDLGELEYILGIEVLRSPKLVILNQTKYILEPIYETGRVGAKPIIIPLKSNAELTSAKFDRAINETRDIILGDTTSYQRLVGKLMYTITTRPDIGYVVQTLS